MKFKYPEIIIFLILLLFVSSYLVYSATYYSMESVGSGDEAFWLMVSREIANNNWIIPRGLTGMGPYLIEGHYEQLIEKPLLNLYLPAFFYSVGAFNLLSPVFGILTIALVFFIARDFYGEWAGLLSVVVLLTVPLFIQFSILAYTDLPVTFFLLLSLYSGYKALNTDSKKWLIVACISLGLSLQMKRTAMLIPFVYLTYLGVSKLRNELDFKEVKKILIILCVGFILFTPYLIRNEMLFGNPIFPFYSNIFENKFENVYNNQYMALKDYESLYQLPYEWLNLSLLSLVFQSLMIPAMMYLYVKRNENKFNLWLLVCIFSYFIFPIGFLHVHSIRYTMILIPLISIGIGFMIKKLLIKRDMTFYKILFLIGIVLLCLSGFIIQSTYIMEAKQEPIAEREVHEWIRENTPEDSVIITPFYHNLHCFTGRTGTYQLEFMNYMKFWEVERSIYSRMFRKYHVDYIMVEKTDFMNLEYYNSTEIIGAIKDNRDFDLVFENEYVNVYGVKT